MVGNRKENFSSLLSSSFGLSHSPTHLLSFPRSGDGPAFQTVISFPMGDWDFSQENVKQKLPPHSKTDPTMKLIQCLLDKPQCNSPKEELTTGFCKAVALSVILNSHSKPNCLLKTMESLHVYYLQFLQSQGKDTQI